MEHARERPQTLRVPLAAVAVAAPENVAQSARPIEAAGYTLYEIQASVGP